MLKRRGSWRSTTLLLPFSPPLQIDVNGRSLLSLSPPPSIPGIMVIARRNDRAVRSLVAWNRRPSAMVRHPANVESSTNLTIPRDHPAKHRFPLTNRDHFSSVCVSTIHLSFYFYFLNIEFRRKEGNDRDRLNPFRDFETISIRGLESQRKRDFFRVSLRIRRLHVGRTSSLVKWFD